jgi:lectin, mannose-binding 1
MVVSKAAVGAFALATFSAYTRAQHVIDTLSFGHNENSIHTDSRTVAHWQLTGDGYIPEVLSDRVIVTPPYPGNKRGALWTDVTNRNTEWSADLIFRASGPERAGGNFALWYAQDGKQQVGWSSIYSADKFDGLAVTIDQYGGHGGVIRGFLNDGTKVLKSGMGVDEHSFGQCDYAYRNLGRFSQLTLTQTKHYFEVKIDGRHCFSSNKVRHVG